MKKNKNIKNKNLKLSNFVIKLGIISTIAGTVMVSKAKINKEQIITHNLNDTLETDEKNIVKSSDRNKLPDKEKTVIAKNEKSNPIKVWDTRIKSNDVSEDTTSPVTVPVVSQKTIDENLNGLQEIFHHKYNFDIKNNQTPLSMKLKSMGVTSNFFAGRMSEDSSGNLWRTGSSGVQKSSDNGQTWTQVVSGDLTTTTNAMWNPVFQDSHGVYWLFSWTGLLMTSRDGVKWNNTEHGWSGGTGVGSIIEDKEHNCLWATAKRSGIQKYDYSTKTWTPSPSSMADGELAKLYISSDGSFFAMGLNGIQKYDYQNKNWNLMAPTNPSDTSGSNISNGYGCSIFEDSTGRIWSIGRGTRLQYSDDSGNHWKEADKSSTLTDGHEGFIMEDNRGTLWATGIDQDIQCSTDHVHWFTPRSLSHKEFANSRKGYGASILQDSDGTLWLSYEGSLPKYSTDGVEWKTIKGLSACFEDHGSFFQDSRGTLWLINGAGAYFKLNGSDYWSHQETNPSLNSIPLTHENDSNNGIFFEDSKGYLWMAEATSAQDPESGFLKMSIDHGVTWTKSKGSNIYNGFCGKIFEDSNNTLWSMGGNVALQYFDEATKTWVNEARGSKLINGFSGVIFEDSTRTLWVKGESNCFQSLDLNNPSASWKDWISSSNSGDGHGSFMFEDKNHILWMSSGGSKLIKMDLNVIAANRKWEDAGHSSNITNGYQTSMYQDSQGGLWSMAFTTPLQKYDYTGNGKWVDQASSGSKITDGMGGALFEDSNHILWAMGKNSPLQKINLLSSNPKWETADSSSNIINGQGGKIIEDSHGAIWAKGQSTGFQMLPKGATKWIDIQTDPSVIGLTDNTDSYMNLLFEDTSGTIWMGTKGMKPHTFRYKSAEEATHSQAKGEFDIRAYSKNNKIFLNQLGIDTLLKNPGINLHYKINEGSWNSWNGDEIYIDKLGIYKFEFTYDGGYDIPVSQRPKDFSIEFDGKTPQPPFVQPIIKQPPHNGEDGIIGYGKFTNPIGAKLQVSENGGPFKDADEKGYSLKTKIGSLAFRWKLEDYYYWENKKEPVVHGLSIGQGASQSGDLNKDIEDVIESKVEHIFKDVNFDFKDWTVDSFNASILNTIKHIKISNSAKDLTADFEVKITADDEHKLSYQVIKINYENNGKRIPNEFYPVITKEFLKICGYINPSNDLSTQQEAQDKVLANTKKELTDALSKITFDKVNDTAYQALVKNLPATWNPASKKFTSSHQDYKIEVKKSVDSKNGKILLKFSVFQNGSTSPVAKDQIVISGFLGLSQLEKQQPELTKAIKDIADKTFGVDEITTGVFNADLNKITKKITIDGYAKTKAELTVHIKASADDKISYTVDPNVILKDANTNIKENIAQNTYNTIKSWKDDITLNPGFLSFADIKKLVTDKAIKDKMDSEYKTFALSTKISIKINANYNLELVLDTSVASTSELRYVISSYELKYNGNSLPEAQKSPELQTLLGTGKKIPVSTSVATTFPALVEMSTIASSPIDDYIVDKFKYFDFQDWTVDSFNAQPSNKTRTITIYGKNDNVAYVTIEVKAASENKLSYKVTKTEVKINNVVQTGPAFTSILDAFGKQTGTIDTPESLRTEKEAQLKAADKAKDDMRIAIDKMTFDKAELPSESESKVFAGWKGQDKYEAYHQEFDVTYNQVAKDSTGEIIVTSTVAPFTKTGPKRCTPESVTNTVSGFMGITQLTNMQSKVKQAILDEFAKQGLNELTSYFFNKDPKNNVMKVVIDGFGDTTAELTLKLDATADDKLSYTVMDVVVKNGIKVVPDSIAGNAISELKKWTGDVDLNPGFLTEEEYEKNLVIKNFKANPNELASEVINAKNTGVSKAVKGEYEFENADFRIDYTPDDETGEVLGKVTRKGSSSNVQEIISGFLKFKAFADAVKTKDLESKLLSALDKYGDSKTFNFKINDDYALELTVAVLPKDDNTISYSVSVFDVKHNGKTLSEAQNSAILKSLLKMKGDIKIPETNTKLLDVVYEKLHGKSRRLDMSQLTKATSIPKPKPTIDLNEVTKELGEFYVSGEQSGSAKLLEENNAPDATGFEFEFQVIDDEKPLSKPTKTLPVNLKNGEHVKITSVLKDGYQVKGKMPEKDVAVKGLKEHETIDASKLTKATEIKEVPEVAKSASKSNGLMIGLVVAGSVTGLILIGLLALMVVKKRKKRS